MISSRIDYITIPIKKGYDSDLRPILSFIESANLSGNNNQYQQSISELLQLRSDFIKIQEPNDSTLQIYYRYGDQLISLESKVPLTENQVRVNFTWQDAFKSSQSSKNENLTIASGKYEKMCVLFNIAAMATIVAEQQNKYIDEGLKKSAKLYQQSSGIFIYLAQQSLSFFIGVEPTLDLHAEILNTLSSICLAQAQEIFVQKAINDNMKSTALAKLSEQCTNLYDEASRQVNSENYKKIWPKNWIQIINLKKLAFQAIAQYYDACVNQEAKKYGIALARIKNAKEIMFKVTSNNNFKNFPYEEQKKLIDLKLIQIEKENRMIFHETAISFEKLPPIDKAAIAKSTLFNENILSTDFKDLLIQFVPISVKQAAMKLDEKKVLFIQKELHKIKEANIILNNTLISFNLPMCVEDISKERIPRSILAKSRQMRDEGGVHHIDRLIKDLPIMLKNCLSLIEDSELQLMEEENIDKQLRVNYKNYLFRTPSEHLNLTIKQEIAKYRKIINNAILADNAVKERYMKQRNAINLLSQGDSDIENYLPPVTLNIEKLEKATFVKSLKQLMTEIIILKKDRFELELNIKNTNIDSVAIFSAAFKNSAIIYEETLSVVELDKIFEPLRNKISSYGNTQDRLLQQIKIAMAEFNKVKYTGLISPDSTLRDNRLRELTSGYECYMELSTVIREGTKFYTDLIKLLELLNQRIRSFCNDRKKKKVPTATLR